jgi:hypothetical protein
LTTQSVLLGISRGSVYYEPAPVSDADLALMRRMVLHNRESSALQYAMRDRLTALGWSEIEVIDDDLGRSAAGGVQRTGFERMVAMCSKQISCRRTTPTLLADDEGRGRVCRALRSGAVGDGQPAMALEPSGRAEHVVQDERNVQNVRQENRRGG